MYFAHVDSGVLDYGIIGKFVFAVGKGIFDSDLSWKRLIRSVCEQNLAKLKSLMYLITV